MIMSELVHALAIDLTEHFQFAAKGTGVPRRKWDRFPSQLARNAETALRLLERHDAKATFFVDGWIAARHPKVIAMIARAGHEIAARGDPNEPLAQTVFDLEAASLHVVQGWRRAPARDAWQLSDEATPGLSYILEDGARAVVCQPTSDMQSVSAGDRFSTGQELRNLPAVLVPVFIRAWTRAQTPRVLSFAVWELNPDVPRLAILSGITRLRTYRNLEDFDARVEQLLERVKFTSIRDCLGLPDLASAPTQPQPERAERSTSPLPFREPVTIIVPCFNEEPGLVYLSNVLAGLERGLGLAHRLSFVFVDDGSTDETWREMQRLFGTKQSCKLVRHAHNRGIGAAVVTGLTVAEDEIVAVIDSDCSYDPARIGDMLEMLEPDVAAVTASPYHALGGVEGVPAWRLFLSKCASALYRLVMRNKLATYTSCFRVYRKSLVAGLALRHHGYIGVVEMLARLDLQGRRIVEYPVPLETRLLGHSKLKTARVVAGHLRFLSEIVACRLAGWRHPETLNVPR
jgi:dolichol-phosphate mannosyltransferase